MHPSPMSSPSAGGTSERAAHAGHPRAPIRRRRRTASVTSGRGSGVADHRHVFSYGLAVLSIVLTVVLKLSIERLLGNGPPLILFVLPVAVTAWYGGLGPGLVATTLSVFASNACLFPPLGSLHIFSPNEVFRLVLFVAEGVLLSGFMGQLHAARRSVEARVLLLEERARQAIRREEYASQEFHARSLTYGALQIELTNSGCRHTTRQALIAASSNVS